MVHRSSTRLINALHSLASACPIPSEGITWEAPFPSNGIIALIAALLGVVIFLVRLLFPSDTVFKPLNFQLAGFPKYISLFIIGLYAYRENWFLPPPEITGRRWLGVAAFLILMFPPMAILAGAITDDTPLKVAGIGKPWLLLNGRIGCALPCASV